MLVILVFYLNISRRTDTGKLVLSGVVEAEEHDLSFRIPGQINSILFDEGDFVDSGTVIAELDKNELEAVYNQAKKNYEASEAAIAQQEISLETIERNLAKIESLVTTGAATQTQHEDLFDQKRQAEAMLEHSRKKLEAIQAAVDLARIRLEYATLIATVKGTVLSRLYEPGEIVMAGSPVVILADLYNLTIRVYLPEIYLGKIRLGQDVFIQIDSHPDTLFPGRIEYISDKAEFTPKNIQTKKERVKQVFAVKISTDSQGGILKPGLPCDVLISVQ